ncbi:MAG: hypothetical protein NC921_01055 [Candidatus Omnitrophica bacterium]|nr:hypothetical protein [Candidatus Omnitrophota bacterium]
MVKNTNFKIPIRALIIGSVLSFITSIMCVYNMMVTISSFLAYDASTPVAIFFIFILGLINIILKKFKPNLAFSQFELLIIYSMLIITNILPTFRLFLRFIPGLVGVFYFATSENEWERIIWPHLRKFLFPKDLEGIKKFFEGVSPGEKVPYNIWIGPIIIWSIYFFISLLFIVSLLVFFRKQWSERENLTYPLIQLPSEIIRDERKFFKDALLWLGFSIPFLIGTIRAFHHFFPAFPNIEIMKSFPIFRNTTQIHIRLSFTTIGLTYFMSQDLVFSIWFFYLLLTLEQGIFNLTGLSLYQPVPFSEGRDLVVFQCAGAFIGFVVLSLYVYRTTFKEIVLDIKKGNRGDEILPYKVALICLISSFIFLFIFHSLTGIHPLISFLTLIITTIIIIGISKGLAAGGLLTGGQGSPIGVQGTIFSFLGTNHISPSTVSGLGLSILHSGIMGTNIAINSLKMSEKNNNLQKKIIFISFFLGLLFCIIGSFFMCLYLGYKKGALNAHNWLFVSSPQGTWKYVAEIIKHPTGMNKQAIGFMGLGFVLYFILSLVRYKVIWWPLNPIGFVFSGTWFIITVWFSVFIGWLSKALILKYIGTSAFKKARSFYFGLILGQIVCVVLWFLIDVIVGTRGNEPYWW